MLQVGISGVLFWIGKQSSKLRWRSLTGPELQNFFTTINISEVFTDLPHKEQVHDLWKELLIVHQLFSSRAKDLTPEIIADFETKLKVYVGHFVDIYIYRRIFHHMCIV